jgi:hypothetical protein
MRSNTLEEKAMYNRATLLLLLLTLMAGAVVPAHADTATFNLWITWYDTNDLSTTVTTGQIQLDRSNHTLPWYSIDVPAPFGTVTQDNTTSSVLANVAACGPAPCFEIQINQIIQNPYSKNTILLAFAGLPETFMGGVLLHLNGAISKAQCDDPCQYYAYGHADKEVAEPASIVLLGCGLALVGGVLRRKLRR